MLKNNYQVNQQKMAEYSFIKFTKFLQIMDCVFERKSEWYLSISLENHVISRIFLENKKIKSLTPMLLIYR